MNILIKLDEKFSTDWVHMVGKTNMVSKLFEYRYQKEYASFASNIYCKRQEIITTLEGKYIAPIIKLKNTYDWHVDTSHNLIIVVVDDAFSSYEIDYLKQNNISFISTIEHSSDEFGENNEMLTLLKNYNETQPKPIGFTA